MSDSFCYQVKSIPELTMPLEVFKIGATLDIAERWKNYKLHSPIGTIMRYLPTKKPKEIETLLIKQMLLAKRVIANDQVESNIPAGQEGYVYYVSKPCGVRL